MITQSIRLWLLIAILFTLQGCDVFDEDKPPSGDIVLDGASSLRLSAPDILLNSRAVVVELLAVRVRVSYLASGTPVDYITDAVASGQGADLIWQLSIDVPANTPFTLAMTWQESVQNLDLIRITREFDGINNSGLVQFSYDFSPTGNFSKRDGDPDYAGFDDDEDGTTNLEELLDSGDRPNDAPQTDQQALLASPARLEVSSAGNTGGSSTIFLSQAGASSNASRDFSVSSNSSWLTLTPSSGDVVAGTPTPVLVSYNCGEAVGSLNGTVNVQSNGASTPIPVQLSCTEVAAPLLSVVSSSLIVNALTATSGTGTLEFNNTGSVTLNYSLINNVDWISVPVSDAPIQLQPGTSATVEIGASCGSTVGTRSGEFSVQSDGGNEVVSVLLNCTEPSRPLLAEVVPSVSVATDSEQATVSTVALLNSGTAVLTYNVRSDSPWLSVSQASASLEPGSSSTLTLGASCLEFIGNRRGTLAISSNGGDANVVVDLSCRGAQLANIAPTFFEFSADYLQSDQKSLTFSNTGNSSLNFTVSSNESWLCPSARSDGECRSDGNTFSGQLAPDNTYTLPVSATCPTDINSLSGSLTLSGNFTTVVVPITLSCSQPPPAQVQAGPAKLNLSAVGDDVGTETITLTDETGSTRAFSASSDSAWLTLAPTSGEIPANGSSDLIVSYSCGDSEGDLSGSIDVQSNGSTTLIPVQLRCEAVEAPLLNVITPALSFQAETDGRATNTLEFKNTGNAVLTYKLTSEFNWLVMPASVATASLQPGALESVEIEAFCGPTAGGLAGSVSIQSDGGNDVIDARLICTAPSEPQLAVATSALQLTADSESTEKSDINISNEGNAPLTYNVSSDSTWLSVTPSSGSLGAGMAATIIAEASCADFIGRRNDSISITSNGGTDSIEVALTCEGALLSNFTPTSFDLSANYQESVSDILVFSNSGNANLDFQINSDSEWLCPDIENNGECRGGTNPFSGQVLPQEDFTLPISASCPADGSALSGSISLSGNFDTAVIPVTLTCSQPPLMEVLLTPASLTLSAVGDEVKNTTLVLGDESGADRQFTATNSSSWLALEPDAGEIAANEAFDLNVSYSCGELEGNLSDTILVQSNGFTTEVPVQLRCEPVIAPLLSVVNAELTLNALTGGSAREVLEFRNTGNAVLTYTLDSDEDWISAPSLEIQPRSQLQEPRLVQPGDLESVDIEASCDSTVGMRSGVLSINSDGGDATIDVVVMCTLPPEPELAVEESILSLTALTQNSATSTIELSNSGNADLTFNIDTQNDWVSFTPTRGSLTAGNDTLINVVASCQDLIGTRSGTLFISSDGGDETVEVDLSCQGAQLSNLLPASFDFSTDFLQSEQDSVAFSNTGDANMDFTLSSDSDWLCPDVNINGVCQSDIKTITGQVLPQNDITLPFAVSCPADATPLSGSLTLSGNFDTAVIPVTLMCSQPPPPEIKVTPDSLVLRSVGDEVQTTSLALADESGTNRRFSIAKDSTWLELEPESGDIPANGTLDIRVSYSCGDLEGDFSDTLLVQSNGFTTQVPVQLNCDLIPAPVLNVENTKLALNAFTSNSATETFEFSNTGNAVLTYTLSTDAEWITLPASTTPSTVQPNTLESIQFEAVCETSVETRAGEIKIESDGGNDTIRVSITCTEPPKPVLADVASTLDLTAPSGESATDNSIELSNTGDALLSYTLASESRWLSFPQANGTIEAGESVEITVVASCESFVGGRSDVFTIASDGGDDSVVVGLTCDGAELTDISPAQIELLADYSKTVQGILSFINSGNSEMNFTASSDSAWLCPGDAFTAECESGDAKFSGNVAPQEKFDLPVSALCPADDTPLTGLLTLAGNFATVEIPASLTCSPPVLEKLLATPSQLNVASSGSDQVTANITFTDVNGLPRDLSISTETDWLALEEDNGVIPANGQFDLNLKFNCDNLEEDRTGSIKVEADGLETIVPVNLQCGSVTLPLISLIDPERGEFSLESVAGETTQRKIVLGNVGDAVLSFTLSDDGSSPASFSALDGNIEPGSTFAIDVTILCPAGTRSTYSDDIKINSDGGDLEIPFNLFCRAGNMNVTSSLPVTLSAIFPESGQNNLAFTNTGDAVIDFTVTSNNDWLCPDDLGSDRCMAGEDTFVGKLAPQEQYNLPVSARCQNPDTISDGSLTLSGNSTSVDIPVAFSCTSTTPTLQAAALAISYMLPKTYSFSWEAADGADFYQLFESTDGGNVYKRIGPQVAPDKQSYQYDHTVALHLKSKANYILRTCTVSICEDSNVVSVAGNLIGSIGFQPVYGQPMNAVDTVISADGNTMAIAGYFPTREAINVAIYQKSVMPLTGVRWNRTYNNSIGKQLDTSHLSLSLNSDGTLLALGFSDENVNSGFMGGVWTFSSQGQTDWKINGVLSNPSVQAVEDTLFGHSVAINASGDRLLVGSPNDNKVHQYTESGFDPTDLTSTWKLANAAIEPAAGNTSTFGFGSTVKASADFETLAITGRTIENNENTDQEVFVYQRQGVEYALVDDLFTKVVTDNIRDVGIDVTSVSVSGNGEIIAFGSNTFSLSTGGIVNVFKREGDNWIQTARILGDPPERRTGFGSSIDLNFTGKQLIVGALNDLSMDLGFGKELGRPRTSGKGYLFSDVENQWQQSSNFTSNKNTTSNFGAVVQISDDGQTVLSIGNGEVDGVTTTDIFFY